MFSSRLSYYMRIAAVAFVFLQLFRMFFRRKIDTQEFIKDESKDGKSDFLLALSDNDELLKYSNVYFIETSTPFRSGITFGPRQACAIEAAARANPRRNIVVLFAGLVNFTDADLLRIPDLYRLLTFRNVHFRWLDLKSFANNTPVESVIKSERLYKRIDGVTYLSEILRMVLLYKFGGIYLDLDVMTTKPLDLYHPNFFGMKSSEFADTSVMGLQRGDYGQAFAQGYLQDMKYFHEINHTRDGATMLTNRLLSACEKVTMQDILKLGCFGRLEVYAQNLFQPFDASNVDALFDSSRLAMVKTMIEGSMAIHMHHEHSQDLSTDVNGETGFEMITKTYCPTTYEDNGGLF